MCAHAETAIAGPSPGHDPPTVRPPFRMDAATVAAYLARQWGGRVIAPDAELYESLTAAAATAGVMGGGTYDALVGLTAHSLGHELLSLDLRAERTYRSLGIAYRLLAQ